MTKLKIYYHNFLPEDSTWIFITLDQFKMLEESGLMDVATIKVLATGKKKELDMFRNICSNYPMVELTEVSNEVTNEDVRAGLHNANKNNKFVYESDTLRRIWVDSQKEDFYALYMHGKGVTAFNRFIPSDITSFRNYYYWRKYLEWSTIERWKDCIEALETHDLVGCNYNDHPFKHFSGNFWWARSSYIRTLDDITDSPWWRSVKQPYFVDRLIDEMWVGHKNPRIYSLHNPPNNICSPNPGLYSVPYVRKNYSPDT